MELMGADVARDRYEAPKGFSLSIHLTDTTEAERVFQELSTGGRIVMALEKTFWADRFGMVVDRFGTSWMINCGSSEALKIGDVARSPLSDVAWRHPTPSAGQPRAAGSGQSQPGKRHGDQPQHHGTGGTHYSVAAARTTVGDCQKQPAVDHCKQPRHQADDGSESPRGGAETIGGTSQRQAAEDHAD
jgi:hypothetical protein